jgi:hypothetical protein
MARRSKTVPDLNSKLWLSREEPVMPVTIVFEGRVPASNLRLAFDRLSV